MDKHQDHEIPGCSCNTPVLVVAIDFGATYSCAAWSVITSCNVHCNRPASLQALRSVGKFPTALLSTDDHQHLQLLEPGHQPDPSSVLLRNFKLLLPDRRLWGNALDEQAGVWRYVDDTSHADSTGGLDETIMVTKYLTQLFNKALNMAKADFPEYSSNVKGVVTYPACFEKDNKAWRDYEYATEMADFGVPIHYMTEHEAALKAALAAQPSPLWDKVWGKASIIIADCGGMSIVSASFRSGIDASLHTSSRSGVAAKYPDALQALDTEIYVIFEDAVLYHLPEPNVPDLVGDMVPESMLGGGLWAEQLLRHQAEARLRPFMGDAVDRAILRRAIDPVMEYLRAELLPAIFNGNYEGSSWDVAIHPSLHYRIYKEDLDMAYQPVIRNIANVIHTLWSHSRSDEKQATGVILTGGLAMHPGVVKAVKASLADMGVEATYIKTFENSWKAVAIGAALADLPLSVLYNLSLSV